MRQFQKYLSLVLGLWLVAYVGAKVTHSSWLMTSLLAGALATNLLPLAKEAFWYFTKFETFFLGLSIVLMGFQLDFSALAILSPATMTLLTGIVVGTTMMGIVLGKKMRLSSAMSIFIGLGSAICGSSAIAAASALFPDQRAREEAGISAGAINLVGLVGLAIIPMLVSGFNFGPERAGLLIGGSLQSLGHVVAAGFAFGPTVGTYAALVKMGRVVFIAPVLLALGIYTGRGNRSKWRLLPSYVYGHIIAIIIANSFTLPAELHHNLKLGFDVLLAVAMVCIGLKIRFSLMKEGIKALALSALLFVVLLGVLMTGSYLQG